MDLQGVVETIANKTEYMGHCLDKLGDASIAMKAEIYDLKIEVQRLAKNVDMIPAMKELLLEALNQRG